ncbi:hypothetical protein LPJ56_006537 [Coemansia sp. RSA 2599]|nr:hypothetical protein LPJ56_006537 [Coemansia sp. RSA 2599]
MLSIGLLGKFVRRPLAFAPATATVAASRRLISSGFGSDEGGAGEDADAHLDQIDVPEQSPRPNLSSDNKTAFANMLTKGIYGSGAQVMGRSVSVATGNAAKAYGRLNRILAENNVRRELGLRKRYEKPKYKRQRLRRESHARRFKDEVRKKVHLIMQMKNWGM